MVSPVQHGSGYRMAASCIGARRSQTFGRSPQRQRSASRRGLRALFCLEYRFQMVARTTGMARLGAASGFALTLVLLGWVFAGMDYTIYSYALPLILTDLNISIPTAGLIFFLSLQGTVVGSLLAGALADAWGRRRVMMGNILLYAFSTGAVALAQSAGFLTAVRFLVNFGVGAEQPVGATYISEAW